MNQKPCTERKRTRTLRVENYLFGIWRNQPPYRVEQTRHIYRAYVKYMEYMGDSVMPTNLNTTTNTSLPWAGRAPSRP